jgi:hypothetical protein
MVKVVGVLCVTVTFFLAAAVVARFYSTNRWGMLAIGAVSMLFLALLLFNSINVFFGHR